MDGILIGMGWDDVEMRCAESAFFLLFFREPLGGFMTRGLVMYPVSSFVLPRWLAVGDTISLEFT